MNDSIVRIDHLNLTVSNLDETTHWYQRVFGFAVAESGLRGEVRWAILRAGDTMLAVYEDPGREPPRHGASDGSPNHIVRHFGLRVADETGWERVITDEKLETFYDSPVRYPHSTSWYVQDPTGYEIEVSHWPRGVQF